jgi:hypothetical protein
MMPIMIVRAPIVVVMPVRVVRAPIVIVMPVVVMVMVVVVVPIGFRSSGGRQRHREGDEG